jgi:hypothetical protein
MNQTINEERCRLRGEREAQRNTLYVGPDFYHGRPEVAVINTLALDAQHPPVESYTMRFGLE